MVDGRTIAFFFTQLDLDMLVLHVHVRYVLLCEMFRLEISSVSIATVVVAGEKISHHTPSCSKPKAPLSYFEICVFRSIQPPRFISPVRPLYRFTTALVASQRYQELEVPRRRGWVDARFFCLVEREWSWS
jgi:hypothetical protein